MMSDRMRLTTRISQADRGLAKHPLQKVDPAPRLRVIAEGRDAYRKICWTVTMRPRPRLAMRRRGSSRHTDRPTSLLSSATTNSSENRQCIRTVLLAAHNTDKPRWPSTRTRSHSEHDTNTSESNTRTECEVNPTQAGDHVGTAVGSQCRPQTQSRTQARFNKT